jgi:hypothetical protein
MAHSHFLVVATYLGNFLAMASKRLGSPLVEQSGNRSNNKKLKIEVPSNNAFCGISDITPQTSTLPKEPDNSTAPAPDKNSANAATSATERLDGALSEVWIVVELFRPTTPSEHENPMVKILGVFTNATAALEHAEEHVRALRTVTSCGVCSEPDQDDDRDDDAMSETSIYERKLEVFREMYEDDEEEEREDGGKLWTVRWGNVTEVWAERRDICTEKWEAGYFTPLPILGEDDRD